MTEIKARRATGKSGKTSVNGRVGRHRELIKAWTATERSNAGEATLEDDESRRKHKEVHGHYVGEWIPRQLGSIAMTALPANQRPSVGVKPNLSLERRS